MSYLVPLVFRATFDTEAEAEKVQNQLSNLHIKSDYVKSLVDNQVKYVLVFMEESIANVSKVLPKTVMKSSMVEVFDYSKDWTTGFTRI